MSVIHSVEVPQPVQHGAPGGIMRRLNFGTGLLGGVGLAAVFGIITSQFVPTGRAESHHVLAYRRRHCLPGRPARLDYRVYGWHRRLCRPPALDALAG